MSKADMRMTNPLTPLEREQLRYIVERVPEWPEGANTLWASAVGHVRKDDEFDCVFEPDTGVEWEHYSPDFTRPEYEAMKAEIEAEKAESDCREVARELAEDMSKIRDCLARYQNDSQIPDLRDDIERIAESALAKYNAMGEGKNG